MKKRILAVVLVIALSVVAMPIGLGVAASYNEVVATVNGLEITADDARVYIPQTEWSLLSDYFNMFPYDGEVDYSRYFPDGRTFARMIREGATRTAAIPVLFENEADRLGVSFSQYDVDMVNQTIEMLRTHLNTPENPRGFYEAMEEEGFRDTEHLIRFLKSQQLIELVLEAIVADPVELARFVEHTEIHNNDARIRAESILARIHAGEDFTELMWDYSEDPGLVSFPYGYTFGSFEMVPEFEQATRDLSIGEISGLVRTSHGYHIVKRVEPDITQMMRPPADYEEELFGAKHILIQDVGMSERDLMFEAVIQEFEQIIANADFVFLPALDYLPVPLLTVAREPAPDFTGNVGHHNEYHWNLWYYDGLYRQQRYAMGGRDVTVTINGERVYFPDMQPLIVDGRTLVPIRGVFEMLGFYVHWEDETQDIVLSRLPFGIILQINNPTMFVGDSEETTWMLIAVWYYGYLQWYYDLLRDDFREYELEFYLPQVTLDVPPLLIGERTMLPLRAVIESVGYSIDWCDESWTVLISTY